MPKKTDSSKIGNKGENKNLNDAATKGDVAVLRGEFKGDMAGLRTEMVEAGDLLQKALARLPGHPVALAGLAKLGRKR